MSNGGTACEEVLLAPKALAAVYMNDHRPSYFQSLASQHRPPPKGSRGSSRAEKRAQHSSKSLDVSQDPAVRPIKYIHMHGPHDSRRARGGSHVPRPKPPSVFFTSVSSFGYFSTVCPTHLLSFHAIFLLAEYHYYHTHCCPPSEAVSGKQPWRRGRSCDAFSDVRMHIHGYPRTCIHILCRRRALG